MRSPFPTAVIFTAVLAVSALSCTAEEAIPIDPSDPPAFDGRSPGITHLIPPTDEMERLARQQCLDQPSLDEGYVEAVDPDSNDVLSEITVDCDEIRADS